MVIFLLCGLVLTLTGFYVSRKIDNVKTKVLEAKIGCLSRLLLLVFFLLLGVLVYFLLLKNISFDL